MPKVEQKHLLQSQDYVHLLYHKYSALLLGYICGIVANQRESEEYLVKILSRFAVDYRDDIINDEVSWPKLLCYSRSLLPELQHRNHRLDIDKAKVDASQSYAHDGLDMLSSKEKEIFCSIYYHGKSIGELAKSMEESEVVIRNQFKLLFDKIRSARGN